MESRSYRQLCPLSYALDAVGERWTLLILRELLFGPRRFKDLIAGLPGIGTNLLSRRMKTLEREGLAERATLPPPAGVTVYRLTERGAALGPALSALADWGLPLMAEAYTPGDFLGAVPSMSAITKLYHRSSRALTVEVHGGEHVFHAVLGGPEARVSSGPADRPDLVLEAGLETVLRMLGRPKDLDTAVRSGDVKIISGTAASARAFLGAFRAAPLP